MDLPMYCIVGERPVKVISTASGGSDVLAYNWQTGEFHREMQYLTKIIMGDGEVDYVSEAEFNQYVRELKNKK